MDQINKCVLAFKDGDYNLAVQMIAEVQHLETITTDFQEKRNVSLLHLAAYHGWLDVVARLHIKVVTKDSLGQTPLHYAAKCGNLKMVTYLYIKQQEVASGQHNWADNNGCLPLHIACFHGHLNVANYLIAKRKCEPSSQDKKGCTPLHYASKNGHVNIVRYLAEIGCHTSSQDKEGDTPLHHASQGGHMNIVRYLITEAGCNPTCQNNSGATPLYLASEFGHIDIVQCLTATKLCDPTKKPSFCLSFFNFDHNRGTYREIITHQECLPLHIACFKGHLSIAMYFFDELKCDPTIPGECKLTPLHYACFGGRLSIIKYLTTKLGCNLNNLYGCNITPLALACKNGSLDVIKYFMKTEPNFKPNDLLSDGGTMLHYVSENANLHVIQDLINEIGCSPKTPNEFEDLPLHTACLHGHLHAAQYFITTQSCSPSCCSGLIGWTPLHFACASGCMNIIQYLIKDLGCDSQVTDIIGNLPFHITCLNGHLDILKYFVNEQNYDPAMRGRRGWTTLHYAAEGGHMNIIQYLVTELGCNPLITDDMGVTMLQVAVENNHSHICQWLLHSGYATEQDIEKARNFCIDVAAYERGRYKLLVNLFQPLAKIVKTFDLHTFSKVILMGNSSVGKSKLAKVINERATTYFNLFRFGNVRGEKTNTAGISPDYIKNWEIGKIVLYDLAGQAEYHSSHSALMETAMQQFPATCIIVVNLNDEDAEIIQKLYYWLNFADSATSRTKDEIESCLIIVGSHADLLSREKHKNKSLLVKNILEKRKNSQRYIGMIAMDCRKINSSGTRQFVQLLRKSHKTVVERAPKMSYYCHLLYAFLQYKQQVVYTLEELAALLAEDDDCPIPLEHSFLTDLLVTLSNKGIVVFLKNKDIIEKSWVVADTDVLVKDINGILFAPKESEEHCKVSSSTGIVCSSTLQQLLPQYNLQMLVTFLELLEICHCVDFSGITTDLKRICVSSLDDDQEFLLFFPCLLEAQRPSVLPDEKKMFNNWFGWCLSCKHQKYFFFTSRFLHVLLLRLVGTFLLADSDDTASAHHQQNGYTVWTNGVLWDNEEGIRTVVELIDQSQRVVMVMSHTTKSKPLECIKHRSSVIRLIRDLKEKLFPKLDVEEYLISPKHLKNWPFEDVGLPDKDLCPMKNVAKSMLLQKNYILSLKGMYGHLSTEKTMLNEPYYELSTFSVRELLDENKADEPVSQYLLKEVSSRYSIHQSEQHSHLSLQKIIEKFSIFSGLNPIVSALLCRVII